MVKYFLLFYEIGIVATFVFLIMYFPFDTKIELLLWFSLASKMFSRSSFYFTSNIISTANTSWYVFYPFWFDILVVFILNHSIYSIRHNTIEENSREQLKRRSMQLNALFSLASNHNKWAFIECAHKNKRKKNQIMKTKSAQRVTPKAELRERKICWWFLLLLFLLRFFSCSHSLSIRIAKMFNPIRLDFLQFSLQLTQ